MKIVDIISLDYNMSSESHNLFSDLKRAAEEADILDAAGHDGIRAEFIDEAELSKEALRFVDTGTPCHLYKRKDGKFGVTRK